MSTPNHAMSRAAQRLRVDEARRQSGLINDRGRGLHRAGLASSSTPIRMATPGPSPMEYQAIAERIRGLIGLPDRDLRATAAQLRVAEASLRSTVDADTPRPRLDILLAIIREYGVDPTWLLSGEYDLEIHRRTMEDNDITGPALRELTRGRRTPTGVPLADLIPDDEP